MNQQKMRNAKVQTFHVLPSVGRPHRRPLFLDRWRNAPGPNLSRLSPEFLGAREVLLFRALYKGAVRFCWAADRRFDGRPCNPRAQALLPSDQVEVVRGDIIIEMTRHIWPTYWVSASENAMEDVVEGLDLDQVAIAPEWRKRGGCFVATPSNKGTSIVMQTLLLAAPDP